MGRPSTILPAFTRQCSDKITMTKQSARLPNHYDYQTTTPTYLSLYSDRITLVYIYIYIYIYVATCKNLLLKFSLVRGGAPDLRWDLRPLFLHVKYQFRPAPRPAPHIYIHEKCRFRPAPRPAPYIYIYIYIYAKSSDLDLRRDLRRIYIYIYIYMWFGKHGKTMVRKGQKSKRCVKSDKEL